jgi:glycosyltransferase involved in cell wall biosynthesis
VKCVIQANKENVMEELSIVVPCFNEEDVLPHTNSELLALLARLISIKKISETSCIYYVDDGSSDGTWDLIQQCAAQSANVAGIKLSGNCGHQNALVAGLLTVPGGLVASMDADLQDDIAALETMLDLNAKGVDIVYGVREDRSKDTFFKSFTAKVFYQLLSLLGGKTIQNHADYRLMSRRAIEALKQFTEVNLFLRGLIPLIGFTTAVVYYKRGERYAGESKYPFKKMFAFAWEGITSLSIAPLRIITIGGAIIFTLTMLMSLLIVGIRLFTDQAIAGWASTVLPIYVLGGIQLFAIGILGEYLGKVYKEVKARPRFLIEAFCGKLNSQSQSQNDLG